MKRLLQCLVLLGISAMIWAQNPSATSFKVSQPWTPRLPTWESRVQDCQQPFGNPKFKIALDDWICTRTGALARVVWWGWLSTPQQGKRPFYIAIYPDNGNCQPQFSNGPICQTCVVPDYVQKVGIDCQNLPIYKLAAVLPTSAQCIQTKGKHYWLQISEVEAQSVRPGTEDFRWASHRPIYNCNAVQLTLSSPPTVTLLAPDPCDHEADDLAFELYNHDISGTVVPPTGVPHFIPVYRLDLFLDATSIDPVESLIVEPDPDGHFAVNPGSPDGQYIARLSGMGAVPITMPITLSPGQCTVVSLTPSFGDLNGDGCVDDFDLTAVIVNFLKGCMN